MTDRIYGAIKKYGMLQDCENIVVGVSGGADSVCLLFVLNKIIKNHYPHIKITAAHINHMLRGKAADEDERYTRELCEKLNIDFKVKKTDAAEYAKEKGISVEMAGREIRYGFFEEISRDLKKCRIAVAHNADDRAETIFYNILRGTGIYGLKGIAHVRGNIIRPLLDERKKDIRDFCTENQLLVREDESNFSTEYTRNKIRLETIPYINERFGVDFSDKLIRLGENAFLDEEFITESADREMKKCVDISADGQKYVLDVSYFKTLHKAVKVRILKYIFPVNLSRSNIEEILDFTENSHSGKVIHLPGNMQAENLYGKIVFSPKNAWESAECFEYRPEGTFYIKETGNTVICTVCGYNENMAETGKICNKALKQIFDYDKISENAVLRNRRNGDVFSPYNGKGCKKLKDFFIDAKVERRERDKKILLADGNRILWIAGMRRSGECIPGPFTKRILRIEIV